MKKSLLPLGLLFCFVINKTFSQTFSLKIKLSTNCSPGSPVKAHNNDLFIPVSTEKGLYITRVNSQGNVLWEKMYSSHAEKTPFICAVPDNGFACFAYIFNSVTNQKEIAIFKCDSSGNVQWTRSLGLNYDDYFVYPAQIIIDSKGNYDLAYSLLPKALYQTEEIRIIKFNKDGDLIFQTGFKNLYTVGQYQGLRIEDFIETFNGGFLVGLQYACEPCGEYLPHGFFLQTNEQGDLISYKTFRPHHYYGYGDYDYPLTVFKNENRYYLLGHFNRYVNESEYYYITSFNDSTKSTVAKLIPYNKFALQKVLKENNISEISLDKYIIDDKNLVNLFTLYYTSEYTVLNLNKYDSVGRICPDYELPFYNYDTTYKLFSFGSEKTGVEKSIDNLFITNGGFNLKPVHKTQVICIDDNKTTVRKLIDEKFISTNASASIFPNPATNKITFTIPSTKQKQVEINVFASDGKLMQSLKAKPSADNTVTLNIASYTKGLYAIKIIDADKTTVLKFIKQ